MLHPLPNTGKDNAPYHHKRSFLSFSAMKTKKDLIEAMVGVGVKKVTLPVKEGVRTSPLNGVHVSTPDRLFYTVKTGFSWMGTVPIREKPFFTV